MSWSGYDLSIFVGILVTSLFGIWVCAEFIQGKRHDKRIKALGMQFARERDERVRAARRNYRKKRRN